MNAPGDELKYIEHHKEPLCSEYSDWILKNEKYCDWCSMEDIAVLQLFGAAGSGKTMLMMTLVKHHLEDARDGTMSYFFFEGTHNLSNSAGSFFRGLIYQIVRLNNDLALFKILRNAVQWKGAGSFQDDVALESILGDIIAEIKPCIFFVDALDECQNNADAVLSFIHRTSADSSVKWLVSSRPNTKVNIMLDDQQKKRSVHLNRSHISSSVKAYIDFKISALPTFKIRRDLQLQNKARDQIFQKANDTFLWVALVFQELHIVHRWEIQSTIDKMPPGLTSLYDRILSRIKQLPERDAAICHTILATVISAHRPLHLLELGAISGLDSEISEDQQCLEEAVLMCGSFIILSENHIHTVHQSAKDFLSLQAAQNILPSRSIHHTIFTQSLKAMSETLKRDIYGLQKPGLRIGDVKQPTPDPLTPVRYSCLYWVDHLHDSVDNNTESGKYDNDFKENGILYYFLSKKYLCWLEALSLLRDIFKGAPALIILSRIVQAEVGTSPLVDLIYDAHRFVLSHVSMIENTPLQVYTSALVFSPTNSIIRKLFEHEASQWLTTKPHMESDWDACLRTFEFNGEISLIVLSDTAPIAATIFISGPDLENPEANIWDVATGKNFQTLHEHITRAVFSHSGRYLASANKAGVLKIWEVSTGNCLQTVSQETDFVEEITFSQDDTCLIAALSNDSIVTWNVTADWNYSPVVLATTKHDTRFLYISHKELSRDGSLLIILGEYLDGHGSDKYSIRTYKVTTGEVVHSWDIGYWATLSHCVNFIASSSRDLLQLWDLKTRKLRMTIKDGRRFRIHSFSHDEQYLLVGDYTSRINVWDLTTRTIVQRFQHGPSLLLSLAFSHDDRYIMSHNFITGKIWITDTHIRKHKTQDKKHIVIKPPTCGISHTIYTDGKCLVTKLKDDSIIIYDIGAPNCPKKLPEQRLVNKGFHFPISHSGTHAVFTHYHREISIWDIENMEHARTITPSPGDLSFICWAHGNQHIVLGMNVERQGIYSHSVVQIWDCYGVESTHY